MSKYGLTVHPEKTRLVRFQPLPADDLDTEGREPPDPKTFDFLGFTHYWGRSRQGAWVVKRKTAESRLKRALGVIPKRGNFDSAIRYLPGITCDKMVEDPRSAFNFAGKIHLPTTVSGESSVSENLAPDALEN